MLATLKSQFDRNSTGYFLVIMGLGSMAYAHHVGNFDKMIETGGALVTAALLAFQAKPSNEAPPPPKS